MTTNRIGANLRCGSVSPVKGLSAKGSLKGLSVKGSPTQSVSSRHRTNKTSQSEITPVASFLTSGRGLLPRLVGVGLMLVPGLLVTQADDSRAQQLRPDVPKPQTELQTPQQVPELEDFEFSISVPDSRRQVDLVLLDQVEFDVENIIVEGGTLLSDEELREYYEPLINQSVSLADMFRVAAAIESHYRELGYSLSRVFVPAQRVSDGVFRISIVEGYIGEILIQGDYTPMRKKVREILQPATQSRPMRQADLERVLLLINDLPGLQARSLIRASSDGEKGNAQLVVTLKRKRAEGFLRIDNLSSRAGGPVIGTGGFSLNNVGLQGGALEVNALSSQQLGETRAIVTNYSQTLGSGGMKFRLEGGYFYSVPDLPGLSEERTEVTSGVVTLRTSLSYPVVLNRNVKLVASAAFSFTDVVSRLNNELYSGESVRVANAGIDFIRRDSWGGTSRVTIDIRAGLPVFGANNPGVRKGQIYSRQDQSGTRYSKPLFTSYSFELARSQSIYGPLSLLTSAQGQYSSNYLPSTQTFSVGGVRIGRAYNYGEISGDNGLSALVELRYARPVEPSDLLGYYFSALDSYELYGFYDFGVVWNNVQLPKRASLFSAGVGTRLTLVENVSASFEAALPLTRRVDDQSLYDGSDVLIARHPIRYSFSLSSRF